MKVIQARFYLLPSGANPVRDWLMTLGPNDRLAIGTAIAKVEYGWPIGMPVCRPLGSGLYEVRSSLDGHRIARVLFSITGGELVLLHGFIKKTAKTPDIDLRMARTRQKEIER